MAIQTKYAALALALLAVVPAIAYYFSTELSVSFVVALASVALIATSLFVMLSDSGGRSEYEPSA